MSSLDSQSRPTNYMIRKYIPRHSSFPHSQEDLTPTDTAPAAAFYTSPRIVTHIDGPAIAALRDYYARSLLPTQHFSSPSSSPSYPSAAQTSHTLRILDLCTSHISHLPSSLEALVKDRKIWLCGIGMNAEEMQRNPMLRGGWAVQDLDAAPTLPPRLLHSHDFDRGQVTSELPSPMSQPTTASSSVDGDAVDHLDATTCVVSVDYLRRPLAVLSSVRAHTRPGGSVHLVVSNRCFPSKAVRRWLRVDEDERLQMCGDYLWWSGWRDVEIVTLKDGRAEPEQGGNGDDVSPGPEGTLARLMRGLGVGGIGSDPLWVVRGRNIADELGEAGAKGV